MVTLLEMAAPGHLLSLELSQELSTVASFHTFFPASALVKHQLQGLSTVAARAL